MARGKGKKKVDMGALFGGKGSIASVDEDDLDDLDDLDDEDMEDEEADDSEGVALMAELRIALKKGDDGAAWAALVSAVALAQDEV